MKNWLLVFGSHTSFLTHALGSQTLLNLRVVAFQRAFVVQNLELPAFNISELTNIVLCIAIIIDQMIVDLLLDVLEHDVVGQQLRDVF